MTEWTYLTREFLHNARGSLLVLRDTRQLFTAVLEVISQKSQTKSTKLQKQKTWQDHGKDTWLQYSRKAKARRQDVTLFNLSQLGMCVLDYSIFFPLCAITLKAPQVFILGVTNKFYRVGEFANTESVNKEE
jgi:hypothetical protein